VKRALASQDKVDRALDALLEIAEDAAGEGTEDRIAAASAVVNAGWPMYEPELQSEPDTTDDTVRSDS
jgi:hypothetical protein